MCKVAALIQIAAVALFATQATAQSSPVTPAGSAKPTTGVPVYRLRVVGVFDETSGDPVADVEVADVLTGLKSLTTTTGTVSLLFLPEGASLVRFRKLGYEPQTMTIAISPADTQPITVVLKPAVTLPTVVVKDSASPKHLSPLLQTFEDHRKTHMGQYITEDVFRKNDNMTMANLLSRLGGIEVINIASRSMLVSSRTPCKGGALANCRRPNCFVTIYTDGIKTFDSTMPGTSVPDVSHMSAMDYSAAEFYPGGGALPDGVSPTSAQCGTLMLYTRQN